MIEIPATRESGPAIEHALREGINIAVTLLFSAEQYRAVAAACMRALEDRAGRGDPIDRLAVIASLPVGRIDEEVDARIDAAGGSAWALRGRAGIASARLLYGAFLEITRGARWRALEARGARVPRPLWASTETRNPDYYDVRYLESLIGPSTVTSVPSGTLHRFEDHGFVRRRLPGNVTGAKRAMRALTSRGIDIPEVRRTLETRAIDARTRSFERALVAIAAKRRAVRTRSSTETHDPAARRGCERGDPFMRHIAGPDGQAAGGPSLEP